jgi:hypothetical protein
MSKENLFFFSTTFIAFFMAVFVIGSINQSIIIPDKAENYEPAVVSTIPSDGETDVARNIVIEITFSEEMDSSTIHKSSFTLMQGSESVAGNLTFSGNTAMFTTENSLKAESVYNASMTTYSDHPYDEFNDEEYEEVTYEENGKQWSFTTGGNSDPVETVDLGSAAKYVILAQSAIHNDSTSEVTGEKGFDPDFKSSKESKSAYWLKNEDVDKEAVRRDTTLKKSDKREYSSDERDSSTGNLDEALEDMITAYNDAADRSPVDFIDYKMVSSSDEKADSTMDHNSVYGNADNSRFGEWYESDPNMDENRNESSVTLEPGIYKWNESVEISTNITLSGNADDVWIFQIPEGLTVQRDVEITLADGAVAEHVFWQVAGEVSLGELSHFEGVILSLTGITMKNGATLNGRILAQTDVTLDDNTIVEPQLLASVQRTSVEE